MRELDYKESWAPKNWYLWTVVLEKTLESPLDCNEIQPVNPKENQSWIFIGMTDVPLELQSSNTLANWCEELTHLKRPWCWERLKAGGKGDDRGWDGWMASPTQWIWVWVNSEGKWWTGRPGVLRSMGLQRVGHNLATELNWTEYTVSHSRSYHYLHTPSIRIKTDSAFVKWMSRWMKQSPPMTHKSDSVASLRSNIPRLQLFVWYFHNFCHINIPKVTHHFSSVTEKNTA